MTPSRATHSGSLPPRDASRISSPSVSSAAPLGRGTTVEVPSGRLEDSLRWASTILVVACGVLLIVVPLGREGEDHETARLASGIGLLLLVLLREVIHFVRRPRPFSSREV